MTAVTFLSLITTLLSSGFKNGAICLNTEKIVAIWASKMEKVLDYVGGSKDTLNPITYGK